MGFLSKLLVSGSPQKDVHQLRRQLSSASRTIVDYGIIARELLASQSAKGLLPQGFEKEVVLQILADYEERLRRITLRRTLEELDRLAKLGEYEVACKGGLDQEAYFSFAIPSYPAWIRRALEDAKREIASGSRH